MLERIGSMFADYDMMVSMKTGKKEPLLKRKGKKENYEINMKSFRSRNSRYLEEMTERMEKAEDKTAEAEEISRTIVDAVSAEFLSKSRWNRGRRIADLNLFFIYYVFPAVLLTESGDAVLLCDTLRDTWNQKTGERINYTDYNTIFNGFNEKILGII